MASSSILSDNGVGSGSAGLKSSAGNDGSLLLQTTTAAGAVTTALTISNTQVATFTNQPILTGGTAGGVAYLSNPGKVLTTGSALTFDGATLTNNAGSTATALSLNSTNGTYGLDVGLKYNGTSIGSIGSSKGIDSTGALTDLGINSASNLDFATGYTRRMRLDSAGNLGLGVTPVASVYTSSRNFFVGQASNLIGRTTINFTSLNTNVYEAPTTSAATFINSSTAASQYQQYLGAHVWRVSTNTPSANTAITWNDAMTLDASGNLYVNYTGSANFHIFKKASSTDGTAILGVTHNGAGPATQFYVTNDSGTPNAANTGMSIGRAATTRSINAAGTINAAGLDYAEYMIKANSFALAKGDVVGINADGKLTNVFDDAISFVVKSTNPSYVGGDTWGSEEALGLTQPEAPTQRQATEEVEAETDEAFAVRQTQYEADKAAFEAALEQARQTVDRIAFAGQVPVNVTGAAAGQYIVPVNDSGAIKGQAVSSPTFEQYQQAVGKVIAIEEDGRARIIVKVA